MKCPYCGAEESKVIDSRPTEDNERIRRRRECLSCHMRFTTYEVVETVPLVVVKKDSSREPFDRQKLLNAMVRACAKRPVSYESLVFPGKEPDWLQVLLQQCVRTSSAFSDIFQLRLSFHRFRLLPQKYQRCLLSVPRFPVLWFLRGLLDLPDFQTVLK